MFEGITAEIDLVAAFKLKMILLGGPEEALFECSLGDW